MPRQVKFYVPCFYLNRLDTGKVDRCKYLSIMICTNNCDIDMNKQTRKFYANIIILFTNVLSVPLI